MMSESPLVDEESVVMISDFPSQRFGTTLGTVGCAEWSGAWRLGPSPLPGALVSLGEGSLSSRLPVSVLPTRKVLSTGGRAPGRRGG